jgi:hypothetical protein
MHVTKRMTTLVTTVVAVALFQTYIANLLITNTALCKLQHDEAGRNIQLSEPSANHTR